MKTLSIIILSILLSSFITENTQNESKALEETVLICTGKYSKRYHDSQCRGMKSCKGEQKKVSISVAKKMGLTPCGYCYK